MIGKVGRYELRPLVSAALVSLVVQLIQSTFPFPFLLFIAYHIRWKMPGEKHVLDSAGIILHACLYS